jgi:hypothetical protein
MTELTPRQILDAIRRGLEETARRLGESGSDQMRLRPQPSKPTDDVTDPTTSVIDRPVGQHAADGPSQPV